MHKTNAGMCKMHGKTLFRMRRQLPVAEMLEVSRQSVSQWELGQAVPDVDKIIRISELFDVSTDTILLRNIEEMQNC